MLLVIVENEAGTVAGSSLEAITMGRGLAAELGADLHAAAFGTPFGSHGELAAQLSKYGVSTLHLLETDAGYGYSPERRGSGVAELMKHADAQAVIAPATDRGNELAAHAAARTGNAFASNCLAVETGQAWSLTRLRGGGMLLEDAELTGEVKVISLAAGALEPAEAATTCEVTTKTFAYEEGDTQPQSTIVERTTRGSGVTLATARVVVSGGRGIGSSEGFTGLEELAELLGGAVGCSRVATNNGWRPHSDQVGQTGTKIAADLYVACGISGATQHWVGCMGAKSILAINTDPEAPLVSRADYAVIGDVHDVLPAIVDKVRARQAAPAPHDVSPPVPTM